MEYLQNGFRGGVVGYDAKDILAASIVRASADVSRFTVTMSRYNCIDVLREAKASIFRASRQTRIRRDRTRALGELEAA